MANVYKRNLVAYKEKDSNRCIVFVRDSRYQRVNICRKTKIGIREVPRVFVQLRKQMKIANNYVVVCPHVFEILKSSKNNMRGIVVMEDPSPLLERKTVEGFDNG